ncbi:MAG TPA: MBL fold metallo-hydrolase [Candidatus Saccharimonadales bacterium]|nr:MBL fold metallo-hydrolase [Candidatus Saccharimonadales bacterium]
MKRIIFFISFILIILFSIIGYQYFHFYDNKLRLIFCDVGQGDAIFIKTPGGSTILVDGGPDKSVLQCLSNHMPFWKRNISMVILTHPHADHLQGLLYVFDRYNVSTFVTEDLKNKTFGYTELLRKVKENHVASEYVLAGDSMQIGKVWVKIIGPTEAFLHTTSPNGMIGENKEFASLETLISYGTFNALLTGDSQALELQDSLNNVGDLPLSILHVPHHGSASGLSREVLSMLNPKLAVISVGLHNLYHHPNPFTISLLKEADIPIKRTDHGGEMEIMSDGKSSVSSR